MDFIAPKNFKSGRLLSNKYTWFDLGLLTIGVIVSVVLEALFVIFFLSDNLIINIAVVSLLALPAIIVFGLVQPNGIYHNFLTFFRLLIIHIGSPKTYIWGGLLRNGDQIDEEE